MGWSSGAFTRGNGTYTGALVWTNDAGAGIDILASRHDTHDQDLAAGINASLHKGGQNVPTANISWGSFKITSLGNATLATDAAAFGQTITGFTFTAATRTLTGLRSAGNVSTVLPEFAAPGTDTVWFFVSADTAMVANTPYAVSGARTMTLPATVAAGDWFTIFAQNATVTIASNGNVITRVGSGNNLTLAAGEVVQLLAVGAADLRIL